MILSNRRADAWTVWLLVVLAVIGGRWAWAEDPTDGGESAPSAAESSSSPPDGQEQPMASSPAPSESPAVEATEAPAATAAAPSAVQEERSGNITVDFKDADIQNVLRILSYKSGMNIIAGPDVQGLVTIRLSDVPWEQALDMILKTYGLAYSREANVIRVTTLENLEQEQLATEVFPLNYAKAKDVPDTIKEMLTDRGKVKYDERANLLVVTDIPTNLFKIKQVVERLDQRTPQVRIEAKIIETKLTNDENLGIKWGSASANHVSVTGPIVDTTFPLGTTATLGGLGKAFIPTFKSIVQSSATAGATTTLSGGEWNAIPGGAGGFKFGTLSLFQTAIVLDAIAVRADTHVVSNPTVVTLNNQEAKVHVGETFNIPIYERNASTGSIEVTGYKERPIGTTIAVTPHVNPQGDIIVDLHPQIASAASSFDDFGNIKVPRFDEQDVKTQVMIRSGETVAIGGLVKRNTTKTRTKVPFLGDLPLIGLAFSHTADSLKEQRDILIFMTVTLIDPEGQTVAVAAYP
ncbi:MAG: secretin and TonB N-terminal domain-containing protein [Candidatus Omnitrophica bacterium]|nr:secretin and TonB N-terminal domain-containing protein [Candidatus Omnitrophota bacterium]